MNIDPGHALFTIRAIAVILVLSSIHPASRLLRSGRSHARLTVLVVSILSLSSPLLLLVATRMRASASNDARVLQEMNVVYSSLPALYLMSFSAAAIILWLIWIGIKRPAA